jgi:hypothetical protein
MGDTLYRLMRLCGVPFRYRVLGLEHVAHDRPAIFVANHAGSRGPLATLVSVPIRFYPWVAADTVDPLRAPQRIYDDVVHGELGLSGKLGMALATVFARLGVGLVRAIGTIPVERDKGLFDESFQRSLEMLIAGRRLLVFPEDPDAAVDPATGLQPFLTGCTWLWYLFEERTSRRLAVHPMGVQVRSRKIAIGPKLVLEHGGKRRDDVRRMTQRLQDEVAVLCKTPKVP